jgi:hypothetical protein
MVKVSPVIQTVLRPCRGVLLHMKLKRGTVREDGKIYWGIKRNKEHWMSKEVFDRKKSKYLEKKKYIDSIKDRLKCGDTREDGKVFWAYNALCANGEYWVTPSKYKELLATNAKRMKKVRRKNPIPFIERKRRWYKNNREWALQYRKQYAAANKDKRNKNQKRRIKSDPLYKFRLSVSVAIAKSISRSGFKKNTRTAQILGCSFEEFKAHIESQFLEGMSWENRSEWHLDHIMPVSMAKTYDEVVRLNHYKNFRPLWAKDNLSKSDKTPDTLVLF